jgi:alkyl sulfatase BDS1-like metallo-beta-lactamase superfamily hydrolase
MGRRATYQFGNQLPASRQGLVDAGLGKSVAMGHIGILAPTVLVSRTPQEMVLDGVRFVFQNVPGSEAPAEMAFYLPDFKAYCGAEILSQNMHNLYTLRGAKVRDAVRWSDYIEDARLRFPDAEVFFASHHWPLWGKAQIADFMEKHRDAYRYIHDQTVRHNTKAVYQHYIGWFDGNPANLDPLPRVEAATRYVALMGGADKTVAAAQAAFDRGEFRWVAELLNQVVFAEPAHNAARSLLARSYEQLGYVAESAIWRNFYLTGAQELRSGKTGDGPDVALSIGLLGLAPVERYLDAMAAGLNGPKADGVELRLNLVFSDMKESYVLWIENAVLHHRKSAPDPAANATLTLTQPVFVGMMTGTASARDVLLGDDLKISGSKIDLLRFLGLIDKPPRSFPIVTP